MAHARRPVRAQWIAFWQKADKLRVWEWKKRYDLSDDDKTEYDGGYSELVLRHQGKAVASIGINAGPSAKDLQMTIVSTGDGWGYVVTDLLIKDSAVAMRPPR